MARIEADWLTSDATQAVFAMLVDGGHQVFAVGGCVRNSLLQQPVKDIDLATDAVPDRVIGLAKSAGLDAVPTGISHGTVTVLSDNVSFEITTFRRDIATDGRRAVVAFSDRIEDDARRRDFTMNALYADPEGNVRDPLNGLPDLRARRVRFIEDAAARIREDYLRSLRYFRFHAWYGNAAEGFDPDALDAIARNLEGLAQLSKERIGSEFKRLLEAPDPTIAVAGMRSTGALPAILPGATDAALGPLIHLENQAEVPPESIRRLASLGGEDVSAALRLSKKEARQLADTRNAAGLSAAEAGYRFGADIGRDGQLIRMASMSAPFESRVFTQVLDASKQVFPVKAGDLMPKVDGKALGDALDQLERAWIASGFKLGKAELISKL